MRPTDACPRRFDTTCGGRLGGRRQQEEKLARRLLARIGMDARHAAPFAPYKTPAAAALLSVMLALVVWLVLGMPSLGPGTVGEPRGGYVSDARDFPPHSPDAAAETVTAEATSSAEATAAAAAATQTPAATGTPAATETPVATGTASVAAPPGVPALQPVASLPAPGPLPPAAPPQAPTVVSPPAPPAPQPATAAPVPAPPAPAGGAGGEHWWPGHHDHGHWWWHR